MTAIENAYIFPEINSKLLVLLWTDLKHVNLTLTCVSEILWTKQTSDPEDYLLINLCSFTTSDQTSSEHDMANYLILLQYLQKSLQVLHDTDLEGKNCLD